MLLFVFYLSLGLVWVCEIEISHMGKNNGNSDLVCTIGILEVCLLVSHTKLCSLSQSSAM